MAASLPALPSRYCIACGEYFPVAQFVWVEEEKAEQ